MRPKVIAATLGVLAFLGLGGVMKFGFANAQAVPYTIVAPTPTGPATTTRFFGTVSPQVTDLYDLGEPAKSWRNIYASGTAQIGTLVIGGGGCTGCTSSIPTFLQVTNAGNTATSSIQFAGGTSTANFDFLQDVTVSGQLNTGVWNGPSGFAQINIGGITSFSFTSSVFTPFANNTVDLGSPSASFKDVYASGTAFLVNGYLSGTLTSLGSTRFPTDTQINNTTVCLSDGTNCPAGIGIPTLLQVTNAGNIATSTVTFYGGLTTANLTATGTTSLQGTTWTNATGTVLSIANYVDMKGVSNPSPPDAGFARFHALTTNGFTRFEQDNEAATNITLGRDNVLIVKNTTASTIAALTPVYITGATGNVPNIGLAVASTTTKLPAIGVVLDPIAAGAFGQVMKLGVIQSVNTSAFSAGDQLYVSSTLAGGLTNVRPVSPAFVQRIGSVLVSGVGNGSVLVTTAPFVGGLESGTTASVFTAQNITWNSATGTNTTSTNLAFLGRYTINRKAITSTTYSISGLTDYYIAASSTSNAVTITLPSATSVAAGTEFVVKDSNGNAAANNISVIVTGNNTIDGETTFYINGNYMAAKFVSDGTSNWEVN